MIPIYLVSSATDSIRRCVVLFKPVPIPTSDPKSEFLCQSSLSCAEPTDPLNTPYTWDISHALVTTYHPYSHSPSALTEYLKQKLRHQRAQRLGHSLPTQVEQSVPLKHNSTGLWMLCFSFILPYYTQIRQTASLPFLPHPITRACVLLQFNLADLISSYHLMPCMISIWCCDTILSILCMIHISEPLIQLLVVLGEFRSQST